MTGDAMVRVSFQSHVPGLQAANKALVGHPQDPVGTGPFEKVNTAVYVARDQPIGDVVNALSDLTQALVLHQAKVDFVSVSLTARKPKAADGEM